MAGMTEARLRDKEEFLQNALAVTDDRVTQQRLWYAYVAGMVDVMVRAHNGEEPAFRYCGELHAEAERAAMLTLGREGQDEAA